MYLKTTASYRRRAVLPTAIFLSLGLFLLLKFSFFDPSGALSQINAGSLDYVQSFKWVGNSEEQPSHPTQIFPAPGRASTKAQGKGSVSTKSVTVTATATYGTKHQTYAPESPRDPPPSWEETQDRIYNYIQWNRPDGDHWPSWHDYDYTDYDPNRWEGMERETGYFTENTIPQLEDEGLEAEEYLPYPEYNSDEWQGEWYGKYTSCPGPGGKMLDEHPEQLVKAYPTFPDDFPQAVIGSASVLGLDEDVCFDRYSRYGSYGLEDPDAMLFDKNKRQTENTLEWDYTNWGHLQEQCFELNKERYRPGARVPMVLRPTKSVRRDQFPLKSSGGPGYHSRTAVLIRTWEGYSYTENDLQAIRALITELSLLSGGEYQVYLLVNIKQREADIYDDPLVYQDILKQNVPAELRDIAVLWTERVLEEWYPRVGDWQVYWQQFMPVQWFSKTHPEFDYIWNWETDARYIGNHYHFLEQISSFARSMPRKHLWERNARFYIPEHHGSWESFLNDTDRAVLQAWDEGIAEPVWGPQPYAPFQIPLGPDPPTPQEEDNFQWGVDEDADLITLQPIWDPTETGWSYRNHIWNYIPTIRPEFTPSNGNGDGIFHPGFDTIPRRVFINTQVRLSKRLLNTMHEENLEGRSMQAEMWPATVALQHGLKAVYAPHPIYTDRKWPAWYMDAIFNANNNFTGRWSQEADSPYNHDREANFGGWSWYFRSAFPGFLYRRWLGWTAKDWGWDAEQARDAEWERIMELGLYDDGSGVSEGMLQVLKREIKTDVAGRMCLPAMLLHPVKNVREDVGG